MGSGEKTALPILASRPRSGFRIPLSTLMLGICMLLAALQGVAICFLGGLLMEVDVALGIYALAAGASAGLTGILLGTLILSEQR